MKILTRSEIIEFSTPPQFDHVTRKLTFTATAWSRKQVSLLYTPVNKIGFSLQLGYFEATGRFFASSQFRYKDIQYLQRYLQAPLNKTTAEEYSDTTQDRHRKIILEQLGFQPFGSDAEILVQDEILFLCSRQIKPRMQFYAVVEYLRDNKIEVPGYTTIVQLINDGFYHYETALIDQFEQNMTTRDRKLLDALVKKSRKRNEKVDPYVRYKLTLLKRINFSLKTSQIQGNTADLEDIQFLFRKLQKLIHRVNLSPETVRYYAQQVINSRLFQIKQREKSRYLFLTAFIIHQYYSLTDILIDAFLQAVQELSSAANRAAQEELNKQLTVTVTKAVKTQENHGDMKRILDEMKEIHFDRQTTDSEKVLYAVLCLGRSGKSIKTAEEIISTSTIVSAREIKRQAQYALLEQKSHSLQLKVSQLLKIVDFEYENSVEQIGSAVRYFQETDGEGTNPPTLFLNKNQRKAIFSEVNAFKISLYKMFLFHATAKAIKGGSLNLRYSYAYRYLTAYLISEERWKREKHQLLEKYNMLHLLSFDSVESFFETSLHNGFDSLNLGILDGSNPYITVKNGEVTNVITPPIEGEEEKKTTADLFPSEPIVSVLQVLKTVNEITEFSDSFNHWNNRYVHDKPDFGSFYGTLIALATNIGVGRFAQMCPSVDQTEMELVSNWYLTSQNLKEANDRVVAAIGELKLSFAFREDPEELHTSSDGQKLGVAVDSFYAGYSPKYFNRGKGVSVLSFVDESYRIHYSTVINTSEREATYVIDGLMHNEVEQSTRHSTDTHGYTLPVFALTHLLNVYFTPRLKNVLKEKMYSIRVIKEYHAEKYPYFRPAEKVNTQVIRENWDELLRIAVTIQMKETQASNILNRLNSYSVNQPTREALRELGKLVKTRFLHHYLSDVKLRQSTAKQLNKGENTNRFRKVIFFARNQEFHSGSRSEMRKAIDCNTLIQNCSILWNYLYLSKLLNEAKTDEEREELLEIIRSGSVVIWEHINYHGEYDVSEKGMKSPIVFDFEMLKNLDILLKKNLHST